MILLGCTFYCWKFVVCNQFTYNIFSTRFNSTFCWTAINMSDINILFIHIDFIDWINEILLNNVIFCTVINYKIFIIFGIFYI